MTRHVAERPDPLVVAASEVVGGPAGRRVALALRPRGGPGRGRHELVAPWLPVAALLAPAAAVLVACGVLQKKYCFDHGWGGSGVFWRACFSDLPRMYASTPLAQQGIPYGSGSGLDQPVLTGVVLWLLSLVVPAGPHAQQWFTGLWAVTAALCAMALVVVTVLSSRRDPWRVGQVAWCPLLLTVAIISPELVGMLFVGLGLWWWSREQPLAAGIALGAAVSARTYALVVVLALGLIALRAGVVREWFRCAGAVLLTWVVLVSAVELTVGGAFVPYAGWFTRAVDYGSVWYLLQLAGHPVPAATATALALGGWVLAAAAGVFLALGTRRRPTVAEVAVLVLTLTYLTAKSVPVQSTLWLVPLAALARLPWRVYLGWMAVECVYFVSVWLHIAGLSDTARALPGGWYGVTLVLRLVALAVVAGCVVAAARRRPAAAPGDVLPTRRGAPGAATADDARERHALQVEPDELAGSAAGQPDRLVLALR